MADKMQTYLRKHYHFETYEELWQRVACTVAHSPSETNPRGMQQVYLDILKANEFCPAGNSLLAGYREIRPNCAVFPAFNDSETAKIVTEAKQLWSSCTGTGFYLGDLSDPVKVMRQLLSVHRAITFEDRPQRGNMMVLPIDHPKIEEFIKSKGHNGDSSASELYGVNISVSFTSDDQAQMHLKRAKQERSGPLWNAAVQAWRCGCPGLIFEHRFNESRFEREAQSLIPELDKIHTTAPCSELGMYGYESCNLGAINLNARTYIDEVAGTVDEERLSYVASQAIRFLDSVVDLLESPVEQVVQRTRQVRRVGLGVTGWADMLAKLGISYDSDEAQQLAMKVSRCIEEASSRASIEAAKELGPYEASASRRNVSVTCLQPTGHVTSLLGNDGYGIEPIFREATTLSLEGHIRMVAAWQSYVENSVAKTINLPESATVSDVLRAFEMAIESDVLKSISVYRDNSRSHQPQKL